MAANEFTIGDLHFGHKGILTKGREQFATIEEHDEFLIERWNGVVRPGDKVRVVGDWSLDKRKLRLAARLNGAISLVGGNHDIFRTKDAAPYFYAIYGVKAWHDLILSHVPLHPLSLADRWLGNVHGHVHARPVDLGPRYFNVSADVINYTPIALETVRDELRKRQ